MVNYGDVLKDQSGQIMMRGENAAFIVIGPGQNNNLQIIEVPPEPDIPMGPISETTEEELDKLKYVGKIAKMVWEEI